MTSNQLDLPRAAAMAGRVGQGTTVEQSRAVAEVQAQVIVAQQFPRSTTRSMEAMEEACKQPALAGKALFRFPRGKDEETGKANILSGPSVHLARELARCWGNVQYGLVELLRDDVHGQSEVMAWAWDMEANMRSSTTFIVPHRRDTKRGTRELTELRDIYENNANMGGRRMREMIFAVLPNWFTSRALEICGETNEKGGGIPLAQRRVNAVKKLEEYRVSPARIAAKYGYASVDQLTATDLAQLAIIYGSLQQNTVSVDDEFPPEPSAAADLLAGADVPPAGQQKPPARKRGKQQADPAPDEAPWPEDAGQPADRPTGAAPAAASEAASGSAAPAAGPAALSGDKLATDGQVGMIRGKFEQLGYRDDSDPAERDARLSATARLAGLDGPLATTKDLTGEQAARVIRRIRDLRDAVELTALLEDGEVPGGE